MDVVKRRNPLWFSREAMSHFNSRIETELHHTPSGRMFFVSSEQLDDDPVRYTIRRVKADGSIGDNMGKFQKYATRAEAVAAMEGLG
jgi:hypothetical protein